MKTEKRNKKMWMLPAAALAMTAFLTLEGASAYFTTYVSAGGSRVIHMGSETEIHEDLSNMTKHISITNTSQINDCFVRVKVFHSGQFQVSYRDRSESGSLWTYSEADGYWYYGPVLLAGASTEILDAKIENLPENFDRDSFNVVVIQECTPAVYDEDGNLSADWDTVYTDYEETEGREDDRREEAEN
jgi:hypothetical protein